MAKGENIYKRKDGRWEGRYKKGYDQNRKIRYGYCYGNSYREAKEKLDKAKADYIYHLSVLPDNSCKVNFAHYCSKWLQTNENRLKQSTISKYQSIIDNHINHHLGNYFIRDLNSDVILEFSKNLLYEKQLAPKTVRDILSFVHKIITYIEEDTGCIILSSSIVYPKVSVKKLRVLSLTEQQSFLRYLSENMDIYKFSIILSLFTGLRIGEVCALQWKDISLKSKLLFVNHTVQRLKNPDKFSTTKTILQIGLPKTASSIRIIPITEQLITLFQLFQVQDPDSYIMTGQRKVLDPRQLQRKLKKYTTELQMQDVHFHTLRHTFATRCIELGFDVKTLSEILGHSSTTITLNRYVHPSLDFKRENILKLERSDLFLPSLEPSVLFPISELES